MNGYALLQRQARPEVFNAGEALDDGGDEAAHDPDVELVDRQAFMQLCEAMLDKAQRQMSQIRQALEKG